MYGGFISQREFDWFFWFLIKFLLFPIGVEALWFISQMQIRVIFLHLLQLHLLKIKFLLMLLDPRRNISEGCYFWRRIFKFIWAVVNMLISVSTTPFSFSYWGNCWASSHIITGEVLVSYSRGVFVSCDVLRGLRDFYGTEFCFYVLAFHEGVREFRRVVFSF